MEILERVEYRSPSGLRWVVEEGETVNGLSVPPIFWRFQPPFCGPARDASVFHDSACVKHAEDKTRTAAEVHRMFYDCMVADGTPPIRAWVMWKLVVWFGPNWKV